MNKGSFEIVNKGQREKLATTNKIDPVFLGYIFNENPDRFVLNIFCAPFFFFGNI